MFIERARDSMGAHQNRALAASIISEFPLLSVAEALLRIVSDTHSGMTLHTNFEPSTAGESTTRLMSGIPHCLTTYQSIQGKDVCRWSHCR